MLNKSKVFVAAFVVSLFLACAIPTQAMGLNGERRCEERIHRAEYNLQNAIRKHGEHSRQAEKRRHELEEVRAHCRY